MSRPQSPIVKDDEAFKKVSSSESLVAQSLAEETAPLLGATAVQVPAATEEQRVKTATRLFTCMMQASSMMAKPFQLAGSTVYNNPKKAMLLLTLGVNAALQSCVNGVGQFAGAPQQACTDAANAIGKNSAVVAGVVGGFFSLASHYATREVGLYREQQNTPAPSV